IHYDKDYAIANGLPGIIVHGALKGAWLGQFVVDFIGLEGNLRKLSCQYRGMDLPNDTISCKGKVTNKYVKEGEHYIECEIWVENSKGEKTTPGTSIATLPSRGQTSP
ncbi:MAG: hypothetical protein HY664_08365, partial [Chloroflexi bacterium]|nr:hypothetical protein [Chloroflexota bacterium]